MSGTHAVAELIAAIGTTYRAIDIRAVGVRQDGTWTNAMAVVRLTYESAEEARIRLKKLAIRHIPVKTQSVHIEMDARPFTEWEAFCSEVHDNGILRVGDSEFRLRQRPRLNDARSSLQWNYSEMRPFDGHNWPALGIRFDLGGLTPLAEERFSKEVHLLGYSDAFEAANALCELNISMGQSQGCDFSLSVPVFAALTKVGVDLGKQYVCADVKRHNNLSNLNAMVCLRGNTTYVGAPFREQILIRNFSEETGSHITSGRGVAKFEELNMEDWVQVRLVHPQVGVVHRLENASRMFVAAAERNVLMEAVRLFCGDAKLDDLLIRAYDKKPPKLNESAGFELHVAWLLGMLGLSTIMLGDFEHIVAPNTKVHRASVDILAVSQASQLLILVACTLNPPKAEDFGNLRYAREILAREVFAETAVRVFPVLFTSATGCPAYDKAGESASIPIVDGDRMHSFLKLLREGQEGRFFEFLTNPIIGDLPYITGD